MLKASFIVGLIFPLCCGASGFKFINPVPSVIPVATGGSAEINCTTNDPNATTSLWIQTFQSPVYQQLQVDGLKVARDGAVYTIENIGISDVGWYQCRATNSLGISISWSDGVYIHVESSNLDITVSPKTLEIVVGESANFTCQLDTGGRQVTLKWYSVSGAGNFNPVPSSQEYRKQVGSKILLVLMVTKATVSRQERDAFQCRLVYGASKQVNKYVTLTVKALAAPVVHSFPSGPVTVRESATWSVSCTVEGVPPPSIAWRMDGGTLPVCERAAGGCSQSDNFITNSTELNKWTLESTLNVKSVQRPSGSDARNYTCLATNSIGSAEKSLQVIIQGKPLLKKGVKNFLGVSQIYCEVEPTQPRPTLQWSYEAWHCTSHESVCSPRQQWKKLPGDHVVSPPPSQATLYSEIAIPDRIKEGFYKCTAKNALGEDSHWVVFSRHVVLVHVKESRLNEHDTLVIHCVHREAKFAGWTKDGVELSANSDRRLNVSQTPYTLTVFNLTLNDSGVYSCRSEMPRGNASVQITVRELRVPEIVGFSSQTVFSGNISAVLYCNVSANPEASVTWTKADESVTITTVRSATAVDCGSRVNGYYRAELNQSALVICLPTNKDNSGRFTCTAQNRLGSDSQTAYLDVLELAVAEIVDAPNTNTLEVTLGQSVRKICRGHGNPAPRVRWFKLEKGKPDVSYKPDGSSNATLYIEKVEAADLGDYSCSAKNALGESDVRLGIVRREGTTEGPSSNRLMVGLLSGFGVFLVIAILVIVLVCRYQKKHIAEYRKIYFGQGSDYQFDPNRTLLEQSSDLAYDPDWEFPEERLILGQLLDSGNFGQVYMAEAIGIMTFDARNKSLAAFKRRSTMRRRVKSPAKIEKDEKGQQYNRTTVAVKTLKAEATSSDYKDLVSELKIMIHVGQHKNIINLLGACTRGKRLMLIIEFAPHGSLVKFLRKKREIFQPTWVKETTSPETEFTTADLAMEAYQVARGLEYLASNKCVHRDVAARNVLIADGYVLKVSDFGLARDVHEENEYIKTTSGALPIKWMALESLRSKIYTEKTDVWSFGVLLWELFTLGGVPYYKVPNEHLIDAITEGYRMECPLNCPVEMYTLMRDCWLELPDQRPTFRHIVDRLGKILEKSAAKASTEYISFLNDGQPNDYYLRPVDSSDPRVVNGAATALPRDTSGDFAHEPLPPIPVSEYADDFDVADRGRGRTDKGAATLSTVSVENESGIGLDDSAGESDKLVNGNEEQNAKVNEKPPVIAQPTDLSNGRLEIGGAHDDREMTETAV